MGEELGVHILGRGVLSPWDVGPSDFVYFSLPKQVVAPSEPNFWTHSLQIHYNGPGLKTETLHVSLLNNGKNYIQEWNQNLELRGWKYKKKNYETPNKHPFSSFKKKHSFSINKTLMKTKIQNYCFLIHYNTINYENGTWRVFAVGFFFFFFFDACVYYWVRTKIFC